MIHIGRHVNVLSLIGAVTKFIKEGELYVVVELCANGSLLSYLHTHRVTFVDEQLTAEEVSINQSINYFIDILIQAAPFTSRRGTVRPANDYLPPDSTATTLYQADTDGDWAEQMHANRNGDKMLSTSDLLSYAYQTANGMIFLAKKNVSV